MRFPLLLALVVAAPALAACTENTTADKGDPRSISV
ncbi:MAG: hypothetical protein JWN22_2608, partial [Nocardioides sp.]|nr:hypothetical protein [Nocardioides sp.]